VGRALVWAKSDEDRSARAEKVGLRCSAAQIIQGGAAAPPYHLNTPAPAPTSAVPTSPQLWRQSNGERDRPGCRFRRRAENPSPKLNGSTDGSGATPEPARETRALPNHPSQNDFRKRVPIHLHLISAFQSARGLAHSKTLRARRAVLHFRQVLDCGGPPPLFQSVFIRVHPWLNPFENFIGRQLRE
jgi:hypothetical protein